MENWVKKSLKAVLGAAVLSLANPGIVSVALIVIAVWASPAFATAISIDSSFHEFLFGAPGTIVVGCGGVSCVSTTNPLAEQTSTPPWTFSGAASVFLLDLFQKGDRFELFDTAVSLGQTSVVSNTGEDTCGGDIACATADLGYSRATFDLLSGNHSLTIKVIQNAFDTSGGAAVFSVSPPAAVPEPATLILLATGLAAMGLRRGRRR